MIVTAKTTQRSASRVGVCGASRATAVAETPNALPATARRMPSSTLLLALACLAFCHIASSGFSRGCEPLEPTVAPLAPPAALPDRETEVTLATT